jgi:lysophospholipase L1-like esterase
MAALAVMVALAALAPAGLGAARKLPYSRTLLVVGDSLTVGTRPYLPRFLRGWHVKQVVSISKQAYEGPPTLKRYGHRLPRVIFVNLGTNGGSHDVGAIDSAVRRTMRIAGPDRCVVWSNIVRPGGYGAVNRALARQAKKRRNLIVFRWVRMAREHPGWFGSDHVHVTGAAYRVRAKAMARYVKVCRRIAVRHQRRSQGR